jgi:hypothetical protein
MAPGNEDRNSEDQELAAGCILNRTREVKMETPVQSMLSSIANGNPGLSGLGSLDRQSVCRFHQAVQSPIQAACLKDEKAIFQTQRRSLSKKQVIRTILLPGMLMLMGSMAPALAQLVVGGLEFPPNYDTFQPPAVGGSYVDPVFGSTVRRMSNAPGTLDADPAHGGGYLPWISDEYSTMTPFNSDNSNILLVHQSYFGLYSGAGVYVRDLPLEINASSEPRWSRADNHTIYYHYGNQLKTYDISSGAMTVVHTFSEYSAISGMGESDISFDGDHFVFAGDGRYVFVYRISADTTSPTFDTGGGGVDSLYITPNNNVTITWDQPGTVRHTGIELFDGSMNFQRQIARADGHMDVTLDADGTEVMVWANSDDPQPICNNGIVKIRLADGQQTCLATLDWSLAVHISGPDNSGFVYVDAYAPDNPDPPSGWFEYTNELLQIKLDGSQVLRLAHHRSRPFGINTYNWQPRVSTSRDGSRVVYTSDYDLQVIDAYGAQYSDAYLIEVGGPSLPLPLQYQLTTATNPASSGAVTAGGWEYAGGMAGLLATPAAGYKFAYFSGDLTGSANPQNLTMNGPRSVVANFQALAPVLTAAVAGKADGTVAGQRVWTIRLSDTGAGVASGAQITGVTLTQTAGTSCVPAASVVSTFPVAIGDIAIKANGAGAVTLSFGGCADSTARFAAKVSFSADAGAYAGSTTINNQPK